MTFLVLLTGDEFATEWRASLAVMFSVALVVTVVVTVASAVIATRLRENESA